MALPTTRPASAATIKRPAADPSNDKDASFKARTAMTPEFRLSYPALAAPKASFEGNEEQYSIQMHFEKTTDLSALKAALKAAGEEAWGLDQSKWPKHRSPLRSGDRERPDKKEFASKIFVNATSKKRVGLVLATRDGAGRYETLDADTPVDAIEDIFYPGCYCRAKLIARAYDVVGNKGLKFYVQSVQKIRDGERLGGRRDVAGDFADDLPASTADDAAGYDTPDESDDDLYS
jgi:hypothetical protein